MNEHQSADQARFREELSSARERLAATQSILEVISRSREDEQPVFKAILENAAQLCDVPDVVLMLLDETPDTFGIAAYFGEKKIPSDPSRKWRLDAPLPVAQSLRESRTISVEDMRESAAYRDGHPTYRRMVDVEGLCTRLSVPLLLNNKAFGAIVLSRYKLQPFTEDEIALIETFAAQAVIAIENVRQFREVQDRLEREAATSNVLRVISQSQSDAQPVFEAIHDNVAVLCDARFSGIFLIDDTGDMLDLVSHRGGNPDYVREGRKKWPLTDKAAQCRAVLRRKVVHVDDLANTDAYRSGHEPTVKAVDQEGIRTFLAVPLMKAGAVIGSIGIYHCEARPFSSDQIELVKTFAAQAVIAIENVRQFRALETLNAELGDRVQAQVGEIERMGLLKRFLPAAVADAVVSSGSEKLLKSHRALLGVLFCDIRGFTAFCETAEPEETIEVLQTYHEEMGKLINAYGAGVDHRMGDGIMVLFNDPLPCDDPAGDAVRLAIAMRARMAELCRKWKRMGYRLGFGVGISLGYATVGMVGFEGRFDYTASGTAINLASRLCDEAHDGEILLSAKASIAVEDDFEIESRGQLSVKGLREPLEVFRLAGGAEA